MLKRIRLWRRLAVCGLAVGTVFQAGTCNLTSTNTQQALQTASDLVIRQFASILTDSVFFLLNNALIRFRG